MTFDSIYDAHGAFTAAVTPPLVVTLVLSVFWRRFTAVAALCTLGGGLAAIGVPTPIRAPFAEKNGARMGVGFMSYNRNKKSVCLDLKTAEGREVYRALVEKADVVVENLRPGSVDRLGID